MINFLFFVTSTKEHIQAVVNRYKPGTRKFNFAFEVPAKKRIKVMAFVNIETGELLEL